MARKTKGKKEKEILSKEELIAMVSEQIKSPETAYVKEVYERLLKNGCDDKLAREKIGEKLAHELWNVVEGKESFQEERYIGYLEEIFEEKTGK